MLYTCKCIYEKYMWCVRIFIFDSVTFVQWVLMLKGPKNSTSCRAGYNRGCQENVNNMKENLITGSEFSNR